MIKNLKKYKFEITLFVLFILLHLPDLGHDNFNTDVWKWKARIYDFGSGIFGLDFAKTIQKYHPGVTLMWLGTFSVKAYNLFYDVFYKSPPPDNSVKTIFELDFMMKLLIVMAIGVSLVIVFNLLKTMFGGQYALIYFVLLSLEPFYLGLSRVIHLEGLMTTFMLASFLYVYMYTFEDRRKRNLIFSAFFASLAVLTKTASIFLIPFTYLVLLMGYLLNTNEVFVAKVKKSIFTYLKWLVPFILFFILIWPAMWAVPIDAVQTLYRGIFTIGVEQGHEQIYFGKLVDDPGFTFYFVVLLLKSTPIFLAGLIGVFFVYKRLNLKEKRFILFSLLFSLLYFIEITIPSKKLDRYVLPAFAGLLFISSIFFNYFVNFLVSAASKLIKPGLIKFLALAILFLPSLLTALVVHPDYFSYFNPVFGGLKSGIYILEPKWLIGERNIITYLEELKIKDKLIDFKASDSMDSLINSPEIGKGLTVGFQEKYYTQIWPFVSEIGGRAVIKDLSPQAIKTMYFVYPVWDDESSEENRFGLIYVGSVRERGVELYRVYQRLPAKARVQ